MHAGDSKSSEAAGGIQGDPWRAGSQRTYELFRLESGILAKSLKVRARSGPYIYKIGSQSCQPYIPSYLTVTSAPNLFQIGRGTGWRLQGWLICFAPCHWLKSDQSPHILFHWPHMRLLPPLFKPNIIRYNREKPHRHTITNKMEMLYPFSNTGMQSLNN